MLQVRLVFAALLMILPFAANADFIEGDIGISGALEPACEGDTADCDLDLANGLDFINDLGIVVFSSGDFATNGLEFADIVRMLDFSFDPFIGADPLWVGGIFSFVLESLTIVSQSSTFLELSGTGTISASGFEDTDGAWSFSADTSAGASKFAWSSTTATVPEPESLALLGLGLLGMALARRRKNI